MIAINRINRNCEVWRKILNSVAGKYDCGVSFSIQAGRLTFEGRSLVISNPADASPRA